MVEHILAIDLGTSGPKVALFTMQGELLGWEVDAAPLFLLPDGGAEQDPDDWWAAIIRATRRLLARNLAPVASITALACTAQWGGTVAVDRRGRHLMNAVIWADARGAPHVQAVTGGPIRILGYGVDKVWRWLRITGGIPTRSGKDPIAHILFLKHERPEIYRAAHKFLDVKDALNARLTGRFVSSPDTMTVHWVTDNRNIHAIDYEAGLLRQVGVEREKLPDLAPAASTAGEILPEAAAELGLPSGVQVIVGSSDLLCAAVGSGAVLDFAPHIYIGTSTWLMAHTPFRKSDLINNMATLPAASPLQASLHDIGLLAMLGVDQLAIPCLIVVRLSRDLLAAEISLYNLLEVVFGVTWAWLWGGEVPSAATLMGGSLVVLALALNEILGLRQRRLISC